MVLLVGPRSSGMRQAGHAAMQGEERKEKEHTIFSFKWTSNVTWQKKIMAKVFT